MATSPAIRRFLLAVRDDMIKSQISKGIRLTGKSADSLIIKGSRKLGAVLEGIGYWNFLFGGQGRGPGRFPAFDRMLQWVKDRRLQFRRPSGRFMSAKNTAFLVGRKIKELGTGIFQRPSKGVPLAKILKRHEPKLLDDFSTEIQQRYIKELNKVIIG